MKKLLFFLIIANIFISCKSEQRSSSSIETDSDITTIPLDTAFKTVKQIFYSLPSPVETAMIIENTDVRYNGEFLLPYTNVDFYETTSEQAVNLGIYSADLSYLTMFNQQQLSVKYLTVCKKLSDELGLLNVISDSVINVMLENTNDKDKIMSLISEQFLNLNSFLEENNRYITASLVVLGGWVEGLYLSVMLVGDNVNSNPDLVKMIYDQKISLEDLIKLLEYYQTDPDIKKYKTELVELKKIFDEAENPMTQENFEKIKIRVNLLRNTLTQKNN